jgi:hypothetical protein
LEGVQVSVPERAVLEMLYEVGKSQDMPRLSVDIDVVFVPREPSREEAHVRFQTKLI